MSQTSAAQVHHSSIVVDAVCPHLGPDTWERWTIGGATVAAPTLANGPSQVALASVARWRRWIRENPTTLRLVETVDDITQAKQTGQLGILLHFQNAELFDEEVDLVEVFWRLGVRMVQLSYNKRNRLADGCGEAADAGLSEFGRACVREMNRVGIVVDCSHTGYASSMEAIELATRPPVFSHANSRVLCDNGRNIWDDQAKAVAAKGGLVGVGGFPAFLKSDYRNTTVEDVLDHIEYFLNLLGADHVGLGLDFFAGASDAEYAEALRAGLWYLPDYPPPPHPYPTGIKDARELPNVTAGLLRRGVSEADVRKVIGENWVRVFRANWEAGTAQNSAVSV